ncbi:phosphate:Na+ symporter [Albidovulum inexpectatum]|uniref:Phosphate:Na+ symporter n=1 Tax=Albidovulum inexpectatum TaxID=196587 RepID=A0A2S5JIC3_9RHOB|nr:Na/Pi cotransporter family protein [Albidovulum inexpectatum]PPB81202.1 phosphate:Na+ symporter [Albidovulum inexpectatum]
MPSLSPSLFLLHVAGAAALLLWAVRLVRTGVERGWSADLRKLLRGSAEYRLRAALAGTGAAVLLQSSTAVAILVAGFVASGALPGIAALSIVLGADLGSAIVARILLVRMDWVVPLLLLAGVTLFLRTSRLELRMAGRVLIGLALIFVALSMLRAATGPLVSSPGVGIAISYLGNDLFTAFLIGGLFAWGVQSSVAAVLVFVTLAAEGLLPAPVGAAMVLGANLGGAMIAHVLTLNAEISARRVIRANLVLRGGAAVTVLFVLSLMAPPLDLLGATPATQLIVLHIVFNLVLMLVGLVLASPVMALAERMVASPVAQARIARISALDPEALTNPDRALTCARREILAMGESVEAMLRPVMGLYRQWDEATAQAIRDRDAEIDRMHIAIKLYLARLTRSVGDDDTIARRILALADIAVNLEGAGNTISDTMLNLAQRRERLGLAFSDEGWAELCDFHDRVLANAQAGLNLLVTMDPDAARALVVEKDRIRDIEQQLQRSHLERLKQGRVESIETSNIHQETLRALKQVNAAFAMIAYPILSETGDLLSSRLSRQTG